MQPDNGLRSSKRTSRITKATPATAKNQRYSHENGQKIGSRPCGGFIPAKGTNDTAISQEILEKLLIYHASEDKKTKN